MDIITTALITAAGNDLGKLQTESLANLELLQQHATIRMQPPGSLEAEPIIYVPIDNLKNKELFIRVQELCDKGLQKFNNSLEFFNSENIYALLILPEEGSERAQVINKNLILSKLVKQEKNTNIKTVTADQLVTSEFVKYHDMIKQTGGEYLLFGGVDTFCSLESLRQLAQQENAATSTYQDGFVAGEGLCFQLIKNTQWFDFYHSSSQNLHEAIANVLSQANIAANQVIDVFASFSSNNKTLAFWLETTKTIWSQQTVNHYFIGDILGNTGAAKFPILLVMAIQHLNTTKTQYTLILEQPVSAKFGALLIKNNTI